MKIYLWDKLRLIASVYRIIPRLPGFKRKFFTLTKPVDSTRYIEFSYLLKMIRRFNISTEKVLDVSSPFILSYILSETGTVLKTDINPAEKEMIVASDRLSFKLEDATKLTFSDASFDLVYSISVIEHIHERYPDAVKEMIRVLKPGGYLYLAFPVSSKHIEEWTENNIYSNQYKKSERFFFQYRFDSVDVHDLLIALDNITVLDESIYWECKDGEYDRFMHKFKGTSFFGKFVFLRDMVLNFWAAIWLLENAPTDFSQARSFGNMSITLQKKR